MKPLLISIIIPTYNQSNLISKAVESVLAQDYSNIELIVADDASTDNTEQVMESFVKQHPTVQYVRHAKNLGRVNNYHHALNHLAHGNYVGILDGDDYYINSSYISYCVHLIQNLGNEPMFTLCRHIQKKAWKVDHQEPVNPEPEIRSEQITAIQYLRSIYQYKFSHLGCLYHRETAIEHGFYTRKISASDLDSIMGLCLKYPTRPVIISNLTAGVWLKHHNNASSSVSNWSEYSESSFRLFYKIMKHPDAAKHHIGWGWFLRLCVNPMGAYILRKLGIRV
jgi:glycosyltransferase involved in cell wall biosynthesis